MFETQTIVREDTTLQKNKCEYYESESRLKTVQKTPTPFLGTIIEGSYYLSHSPFGTNNSCWIDISQAPINQNHFMEITPTFVFPDDEREYNKVDSFLNRIKKKIDSFINFAENWDGENSACINADTISLVKAEIKEIDKIIRKRNNDDKCFKDYFNFVGPVSDGSITIELKNKNKELDIEFNSTNLNKFYFISLEIVDNKDKISEGYFLIENLSSKIDWLLNA